MTIAFILCNDMHMDIEKANIFLNYAYRNNSLEVVTDYTIADIVVVYTCAFGVINRKKSVEIIADVLQNAKSYARVIVTGCMVKTNFDELSKIGGIEISKFEDVLQMVLPEPKMTVEKVEPVVVQNTVIISEGCKHKCSYCLYSNLCCEYKSKPFEDVYREVKNLDKTESTIYITGAQETSSYGIDINDRKPMIEKLMDTISTDFPKTNFVIGWFHPAGLTDSMISVLEKHENIVEIMLHIQHTSEEILKAMRRPSFKKMNNQILKLKEARPDIRISTEVIVGFPGETQEDFLELVKYLDKGYFYDIGVAIYEPVSGTIASRMENKVDFNTAKKRMNFIKNRYNATCYPTEPETEFDLIDFYYKTYIYLHRFPKKILNDSQVYEDIACTDTQIKLHHLTKHINNAYSLVLKSRTKFEFSKNRNIFIETYSPEAREFFFSIIENGDFKAAIIERARKLLE